MEVEHLSFFISETKFADAYASCHATRALHAATTTTTTPSGCCCSSSSSATATATARFLWRKAAFPAYRAATTATTTAQSSSSPPTAATDARADGVEAYSQQWHANGAQCFGGRSRGSTGKQAGWLGGRVR